MSRSIRRPLLAVLALLAGGLLAASAFAADPAAAPKPADTTGLKVAWEADTCVYSQGEWVLRITYSNKGTRSEGQDGELLKAGQPVKPSKEGEVLDTPLGQMKHYGAERKTLWANTGWNFADKKQIKASGQVKATD